MDTKEMHAWEQAAVVLSSDFQVPSSEFSPAQRPHDFTVQFPIRTAPAAG
jgi:hypothetical protein